MKTLWNIFVSLGVVAAASAASSELPVAHRSRFELAEAVAAKAVSPEVALARLRSATSSSRAAIGEEADFGQAADAVGRHLIGMRRPDDAEPFFLAAAKSLEQAARSASDKRPKAHYLAQLATIQAAYLNRFADAKANIAAAVDLLPEDKDLRQRQARLMHTRSDSGKGPGRK